MESVPSISAATAQWHPLSHSQGGIHWNSLHLRTLEHLGSGLTLYRRFDSSATQSRQSWEAARATWMHKTYAVHVAKTTRKTSDMMYGKVSAVMEYHSERRKDTVKTALAQHRPVDDIPMRE